MPPEQINQSANAATPPPQPLPPDKPDKAATGKWQRFKNWYVSHKKWSVTATVLVILIIICFGLPFSRYKVLGLVLKKNFTVQVIDDSTNTPVSGVSLSSGKLSAQTGGNGRASLRLPVGPHQFMLTKKYYDDQQLKLTVPILKQKTVPSIGLNANGRQVEIDITNLLTKKPLADVDIGIGEITAKTDKDGKATVAVPANLTTAQAKLSLDGYNDSSQKIKISDLKVQQNDLTLTPVGRLYFLSTRNGSLDIIKANLDGSDQQTVLTGTGAESSTNSQLSQSPDGKYLVLLAKRNVGDATPQLYVMSTNDDKLLNLDSGNYNFGIVGWAGDSLVYTSVRADLPPWQPNASKIKAYYATSGKTIALDQSAGSDSTSGVGEVYNNVLLAGQKVVYSKYWAGDKSAMAGKQNSLQVTNADGTNHTVVASYDAPTTVQQIYQHSPNSFYIAVNDPAAATYYDYTVGSAPKQISLDINQITSNINYFFNLDGSQAFWSETRDGKSTPILSDGSGNNQKTLDGLSGYTAAGWYTSQYLLLIKNTSQLYVVSSVGGTPIKVADFQPTTPLY